MNNATAVPTLATPSKGLHIGLWVTQALLALAFLGAGATKIATPIAELEAGMPWVAGAMGGAVRFIGAVEILGGIGLILPAATRIMPRLTPLAASGLLVVMVLGAATHVARGEYAMILANLILGGMAAFIAWGRNTAAPIAPKG